ncbi:hypothetical protein BGC31_05640 [Komagataeibacter xylinus]|nr:hypothetical protein BGC31_05640 [Komagataeibacter xylinus]
MRQALKQEIIRKNRCKKLAVCGDVSHRDRNPVTQHGTLGGRIQAQQQLDQRGLARAIVPVMNMISPWRMVRSTGPSMKPGAAMPSGW